MKRLVRLRSSQLLLEPTCIARFPRRPATGRLAHSRRDARRTFSASCQLRDRRADESGKHAVSEQVEIEPDSEIEAATERKYQLSAEDAPIEAQGEDIPDDAILEDGVEASPTEPLIKLPPRRRRAERPDKVTDPDYIPAETGDGLEVVGGLEGWWEKNGNWDTALNYRGFGPIERIRHEATLEILARAAVIEALAVKEVYGANANTMLIGKWAPCDRAGLDRTLGIKLVKQQDGTMGLDGDIEAIVSGLERPEAKNTAAGLAAEYDIEIISPEEAEEIQEDVTTQWKHVSLEDAWLKFAIQKRILQTTGHILPDAKLVKAHTTKDLLEVLITPPPPKKLAQDPDYLRSFEDLPNIKIHDRRQTPIDKEKAVGRWKLIVEELEERGLPVTGTDGYTRPTERSWLEDLVKKGGFRKQHAIDGTTPGKKQERARR